MSLEESNPIVIDYETLLTKISQSGPVYRWVLTLFIATLSMKSAFDMFVLNLSTIHTPFHCTHVVINNRTVSWGNVLNNYSLSANSRNFSIMDFTCTMPTFSLESEKGDTAVLEFLNITSSKCDKWTFLPDWSSRWNMMMEYQMVCDREYLNNRIQTIMQAGIFISTVFGFLGDLIGRKALLLAFCYLDLTSNILLIFVKDLTVHMVLRFFMGFGAPAVLIGLVLITELVAMDYRGLHGNMIWILWVAGYAGAAPICYYIANWRHQMILVVCLIGVVYATYWFSIPESPRWLLTRRKIKKAKASITTMAKFSGCKDVVQEFNFDDNPLLSSNETNQSLLKKCLPSENLWNKKYLITLSVMSFQYFVVSLVYFAMSFQRNFITQDPYLNVLISGLLEFPAYVIAWLLTNKVGRKYTTLGSLIGSGLGLIILPYLPITSGFGIYAFVAILVKFLITVGFSILGVYGSEVLPTTVRSMSFFVMCLVLRLGQLFAPELGDTLKKIYEFLPQLVYGGLTIVAGLTVLVLPETKDKPMPNTMSEMYKLGVKCPCCYEAEDLEKDKRLATIYELEPLELI